jgi:hypothetical protein
MASVLARKKSLAIHHRSDVARLLPRHLANRRFSVSDRSVLCGLDEMLAVCVEIQKISFVAPLHTRELVSCGRISSECHLKGRRHQRVRAG